MSYPSAAEVVCIASESLAAMNPDQYGTDRHRPGAVLREAIATARAEVRGDVPGVCLSMVNLRISTMNLARWRRGLGMRSWTYDEAFRAGPGNFRMHETLVKVALLGVQRTAERHHAGPDGKCAACAPLNAFIERVLA